MSQRPNSVSRPLWSVMVPAYNCAEFLGETLESVLAQDRGEATMQIEVIDHCSTTDDPFSVVEKVGKGRVAFYRKEVNEGPVAVFNECIRRSRGHLVHILHGDDYVLPGFYDEIERMHQRGGPHAFFATRSFRVDESGKVLDVSERLLGLEEGGNDASAFFYETALQFPGVVIRREFYEGNGGYSSAFSHVVDREMWVRAIMSGGGMISPKALACYRVFARNDSSKLRRTGENVREIARLGEVFAEKYAGYSKRRGLKHAADIAETQARFFEETGDHDAAIANWKVWRELASWDSVLKSAIKKVAHSTGLSKMLKAMRP